MSGELFLSPKSALADFARRQTVLLGGFPFHQSRPLPTSLEDKEASEVGFRRLLYAAWISGQGDRGRTEVGRSRLPKATSSFLFSFSFFLLSCMLAQLLLAFLFFIFLSLHSPMATASTSSSRTRRRPSGPVLRSLSPSGRFYSSSSNASIQSTASAFASSTSSSFSSPSSAFFNNHQDRHSHQYRHTDYHHHRFASPTRVNLYTSSALSPAVRFSIEHRSSSLNRSIIVSKKNGPIAAARIGSAVQTPEEGDVATLSDGTMTVGGGVVPVGTTGTEASHTARVGENDREKEVKEREKEQKK